MNVPDPIIAMHIAQAEAMTMLFGGMEARIEELEVANDECRLALLDASEEATQARSQLLALTAAAQVVVKAYKENHADPSSISLLDEEMDELALRCQPPASV